MFLPRTVHLEGVLSPLSSGKAGIHETLRAMRRLVREARSNLIVRQTAARVVYLSPEKNEHHEVEAIFYFVRDNIRYTKDIVDVETLATPEKTLALGYGDCDDQTTLLAALYESVGYPTRFVVAGYGADKQPSHVYLEVWAANEWIPCDPTEPNFFGWEPPDATVIFYEEI
jgi:transglutaminase-like putative cysteine protease